MSRRLAILGALAALLSGCGGEATGDAPAILYGADVCDRCRMVISEERHAAAARLAGRDYRFDDPGCLVAFLGEQEGAAGVLAWVHDEAASWRPAGETWFVVDPGRGTPMASGILGFGSAGSAARAAERHGGRPLRWPELAGRAALPGAG